MGQSSFRIICMQWLIIEFKLNLFITVVSSPLSYQYSISNYFWNNYKNILHTYLTTGVSYIIKLCSIRMVCEILEWFFQMSVSPFCIDSHVPDPSSWIDPFHRTIRVRYKTVIEFRSFFDTSFSSGSLIMQRTHKMPFTSLVFYDGQYNKAIGTTWYLYFSAVSDLH